MNQTILTEEQKAAIRVDFVKFSGGYHPGEAGKEHEEYVNYHSESDKYDSEALDAFLTEWGEEELAKYDTAHAEAKAKMMVVKVDVKLEENRTLNREDIFHVMRNTVVQVQAIGNDGSSLGHFEFRLV